MLSLHVLATHIVVQKGYNAIYMHVYGTLHVLVD